MTSNLCPSPKEGHKEFLEMNLCYANQNETVMAGNRTNLSNVLTAHCDEAIPCKDEPSHSGTALLKRGLPHPALMRNSQGQVKIA